MWWVPAAAALGDWPHTSCDLGPQVGPAVWLLGLALEATADSQKNRWRADPANKGKFIDTGESRWPTRHGTRTLHQPWAEPLTLSSWGRCVFRRALAVRALPELWRGDHPLVGHVCLLCRHFPGSAAGNRAVPRLRHLPAHEVGPWDAARGRIPLPGALRGRDALPSAPFDRQGERGADPGAPGGPEVRLGPGLSGVSAADPAAPAHPQELGRKQWRGKVQGQ